MTDRINSNAPDMHAEFGELDEIVMDNCKAHLEQIDHDKFCLILSKPGRHVVVWIFKKGRHVHAKITEGE